VSNKTWNIGMLIGIVYCALVWGGIAFLFWKGWFSGLLDEVAR